MSNNIEVCLYTSINGSGTCMFLGKLPIYKTQFQALYSVICLDKINVYYDLDNKIVIDLMEYMENNNSISFYVKKDNNSLNNNNDFIFYFNEYAIHKDLDLHKILYNELIKYKYFFQFIT
jgi:hypothetical protein